MILIGQFDSSFTRRVGIALHIYGLPFEHRPWSVFGDADRVMALNPLGRVPILVLDDGTALVDSHMILDHLDSRVDPGARLFPVAEPTVTAPCGSRHWPPDLATRREPLLRARLHDAVSPALHARLSRQIAATLAMLEVERAAQLGPWWHGVSPGHADIAVACVLRHLRESLPDTFDAAALPALAAHCDRAEALPVFVSSASHSWRQPDRFPLFAVTALPLFRGRSGWRTGMSFAQRFARRIVSEKLFRDFETETRKWVVECTTCGDQRDLWDLGGIKYKARGTSYTVGKCYACNARRTFKIWKKGAAGR